MDGEQVLKLLMEMGPESSSAFTYWVGLQVFADVTNVMLTLAFFYLVYTIFTKVIGEVTMENDLKKLREITDPTVTGSITNWEMIKMSEAMREWKESHAKYQDLIKKQSKKD